MLEIIEMAERKQFKLPDVGEGLTEAEILRWDVKVGDVVVVNQTLVEVETAKAAVELPSPFAGEVLELHYDEGATVEVGRPIITIKVGGGEDLLPPLGADGDSSTPARESVLVGYGVSGERGRRRKRVVAESAPTPTANPAYDVAHTVAASSAAAPPAVAAPSIAAPKATAPEAVAVGAASTVSGPAPAGERAVLAKPPVRKLAKALGVDLSVVPATGPGGSISRADVEAAATGASAAPTADASAAPTADASAAPTADAWAAPTATVRGGETRIPIKGVRRHMAAAMVASAFTAPHVTEFIAVDVTEMVALRDRVAARREFRGLKVSPLLFVARAALWAARRTPIINSTWDEAAGEIVVKGYVNLGIAAATDRGLIVPNIKGAERLSLAQLASALADLAETARSGKTPPSDMGGGTFTITNVGVFGIDTGTPIINPGEAAILAVGAISRRPWVVGSGVGEHIEPRWVAQLAVSFDHRSVDGQRGSEFLADVAAVLADPGLALL